MKKIIGLDFNNSYLSLPKCFYERTHPTPVKDPEILIFNEKLSLDLGIDFSNLTSEEKAKILSGNTILDNNGYYSKAYAGHQYGHFTILGDGRAIIIGEHITPQKRVDIQLKDQDKHLFLEEETVDHRLGQRLESISYQKPCITLESQQQEVLL